MADQTMKASTCSIQALPPEVLHMVLQHLSVADLLWARLVNRKWFEAVSASSPRIVYNFAVGAEANPASIRTLVKSKFPYQNFRIFIGRWDSCALPVGIDMLDLKAVCSKALSFQFMEGGVEPLFLCSLLEAAAGTLKALSFEGCRGITAQQLFRPPFENDPMVLLHLEQLVFIKVYISDALLADALPLAPKLRALSMQRCKQLVTCQRLKKRYPEEGPSSINSPSKQAVTAHVLFGLLAECCPHIESLDIAESIVTCDPHWDCFVREMCQAAASYPSVQLKALCLEDAYPEMSLQMLSEVSPCLTANHGWRVKFSRDPSFCEHSGQELLWLCRKQAYPATTDGVVSLLRAQRDIEELYILPAPSYTMVEEIPPNFLSELDLSCLTTLGLEYMCWSTSQWREAIATLSAQCGKLLTSLSLLGNAVITDDILPGLCAGLPRLRMLSLAHCNVTYGGYVPDFWTAEKDHVPPLSKLKVPFLIGFPALAVLDLSGCKSITDFMLEYGLNNPALEFLDISFCDNVTDRGLQALNTTARNLLYLSANCPLLKNAARIREFIRSARRLRGISNPAIPSPISRQTLSTLPSPYFR